MKTQDWNKLNEVFHNALELPKNQRKEYINEECGNNAELIREVENLIASAENGTDFLDKNALGKIDKYVSFAADLKGRAIGQYEIIKEIGRGGMGAVFLAERADKEFDQKVAIKIVHNQFANEALLERFRSERQILASLKHPNIAHLIDGGTTEEGLPYFVMEYVEGETLLKYCDKNKLTTFAKLELFREICSAVNYAHTNLIIHRDIKPTNIIVTKEGNPKLLDFGIAKPFSVSESDISQALTKTGGRLLTPDYASPEQISGEIVTTTTDVYSLGVVLYELLTGHRPFKISTHTPLEALKMICEEEPTRPSKIVKSFNGSGQNKQTSDLHEIRNTQIEKLTRQLSGDIDNIILKSLRKEPERRYSTVNGFSLDIKRHIDGLPVSARPDTFSYRAEKFIKRNKFSVIAGTVVAASLVGETIFTLFQNSRLAEQRNIAEKQKRQAEKEQEKATRVSAFMVDLFRGEETKEDGKPITAKEILRNGSERVIKELKDEPDFQAALLETMAYASKNIGLYKQALKLSRLALDIRQKTLGHKHAETIRTLDIVAGIEFSLGNYLECEKLNKKILRLSKNTLGESPQYAKSFNELGVVLNMQGKWAEAEIAFNKGIKLTKKLLNANDERLKIHTAETYFIWGKADNQIDYAFQNYNFAAFLAALGKLKTAEKQYRESLSIYRKNENQDPYGLAYALNGLGLVQSYRGNFTEGLRNVREALQIRRKAFGSEHSMVCYSEYVLGVCLYESGDFNKALKYLNKSLVLRKKLSGRVHPHIPLILVTLGLIYRQIGEYETAKTYLREASDLSKKIESIRPSDLARIKIILGSILIKTGEQEKGGRLIKSGFKEQHENLPPKHWLKDEARAELGIYYYSINQTRRAKKLLTQSIVRLKAIKSENSVITRRVIKVLSKIN